MSVRWKLVGAGLLGLSLLPMPERWRCGLLGHEPSWYLAATTGQTMGPVCARCGLVLFTRNS